MSSFNSVVARQIEIQNLAGDYAQAERSDPFTYARILSHFRNNSHLTLEDYSVFFREETVHLPPNTFFSSGASSFKRMIPHNMKRP